MRSRFMMKALFAAGCCAVAVLLLPALAAAQTASTTKVAVPANGCAVANAALQNGQTCAAACNEQQWCPVQWCVMGKLEQTVFSCYEPSGLCQPKC